MEGVCTSPSELSQPRRQPGGHASRRVLARSESGPAPHLWRRAIPGCGVLADRIGRSTFGGPARRPLTNAGIVRAGNLELFLNSMAGPSGEPLSIYWDEYFHGARGSLWSYIAATPLPWGMLQIALLMLALMFTFSRRSGPIVQPAAVSRLSPLEFVETMGGLYQRAHAAPIAVAAAYRLLRLELIRRLGFPVSGHRSRSGTRCRTASRASPR